MHFRDLFIHETTEELKKGEIAPVGTKSRSPVGMFLTPKSLSTFPAASSAVTVIWLLIKSIFPGWGDSTFVPFIVAMLVGALILISTTSKPALRPKSWQQWTEVVGIALINSAFLASSALGLLKR